MMGDNRSQSFDSRSWGALDAQHIRGEPFIRLYPFDQINMMPGRYRFDSLANSSGEQTL
jgi:hypothetical protein